MITAFKDFLKSLNKITKIFLYLGTPIILSLFTGGLFLQITMLINGWSSEISEMSQDLIKCAADSFSALYIPALFIELFSGKYR